MTIGQSVSYNANKNILESEESLLSVLLNTVKAFLQTILNFCPRVWFTFVFTFFSHIKHHLLS